MKRALLAAAAILAFMVRQPAFAADTLETYGIGATDYELYLSYEGAGMDKPERGFATELLLGIGLVERFSGEIFAFAESNENLSEGTGGFGFGLLSTPLETEHVDLDLGLALSLGGLGSGTEGPAGHYQAQFGMTPYLELNLDSDNEMSGYGMFVYYALALTGRDESELDPQGEEIRRFKLTPSSVINIGAYYSLYEGQQLFLVYDMIVNHRGAGATILDPNTGEFTANQHGTEVGGFALGYNFNVNETIEMITEIYFDIPQDDADFGVTLTLGLIATLPSAAKD